MLRLRRYRVLLICAFVITVLLYHVSKNSQWDHSREIWHGKTGTNTQTRPDPPPVPEAEHGVDPDHDHDHDHDHEHNHENDRDPHMPQKPQYNPPPVPPFMPDPDPEPTIMIHQLKTADGEKGGYGLPTKAATVPDREPPSNHDQYQKQNENAGIQEPEPTTSTVIHWQKPKEWFPVPEESIIPLPTGKPKSIPRVQFAFGDESPAAKEKRHERLAKIKAEAEHSWSGYKKYAWTHDELTPVTKKSKDPFCGWAATLVDSLDTLWIMGMKDEFDDAVKAVGDIDFTTTPYRSDIPVFETIIRYLGGMIGAYDLTGKDAKYSILLDKAVELAEILMSVFDTPNRLPILYYNWKPSYNKDPKRASASAGVAELGSMSLEFTRLAQLTGKHKYYDAIARVTNAFEDLQNREHATAIPGVFPEHLDASGCNRSATLPPKVESSSKAAQGQADNDDLRRAPAGGHEVRAEGDHTDTDAEVGTGFHRGPQKRDASSNIALVSSDPDGLPENWECVPQGLVSSGWGGSGSYSMGGSQDSTYEYFPKQYLMLGGLENKYRTMHEKTVDGVNKHLLFRPMAEGDPDILFSAKGYTTDGTVEKMTYEWEVTHLTCFLGGMFGLGGKIFDRPEDVEIGKKLTDGCVWAYDSMPAGVMPEYGNLLPCKDRNDCHYDKAAWYAALDPSAESRETQMDEYYVKLADWKQQVKELKKEHALREHAEERKHQADAQMKVAAEAARTKLPEQSEGTLSDLKEKDTVPASNPQKRDALGDREAPSDATSTEDKAKKLHSSLDFSSNGENGSDQKPMSELVLPPAPSKPATHQEYVEERIKSEGLPSGFVNIRDRRYILRPEAIESVWYMYRITGDPSWQEKGWRMFEAVVRATRTDAGHSAIHDVTTKDPANAGRMEDSMESFWLAETLKYFYLLFETPDVVSLDEWVLNTEAHPFRRPM
ncbi:glycosyl hydrolase family 47-domain-containing protein [Chaetomium sp. MPI-CAGE-AT-0009]|nr:glycosyl hydrolase family 47-domain-containing protein [Chaetomium sp. MPI-CAGE-AT-0009]